MAKNKKKEEVFEFFGQYWDGKPCKNSRLGNGIVIKFSDRIEFTLQNIMEVSKYFGTEQIAFESYFSGGGCDTCGYGNERGFELYIYQITKNNPF